VASGSRDRSVVVWSLLKNAVNKKIPFAYPVYCLKYTPDNKHLVIGTSEESIFVYDRNFVQKMQIDHKIDSL